MSQPRESSVIPDQQDPESWTGTAIPAELEKVFKTVFIFNFDPVIKSWINKITFLNNCSSKSNVGSMFFDFKGSAKQ